MNALTSLIPEAAIEGFKSGEEESNSRLRKQVAIFFLNFRSGFYVFLALFGWKEEILLRIGSIKISLNYIAVRSET